MKISGLIGLNARHGMRAMAGRLAMLCLAAVATTFAVVAFDAVGAQGGPEGAEPREGVDAGPRSGSGDSVDESLVAAPGFSNAPIGEVLTWAGKNAGMSFMSRDGVLDDGESKRPLRVSFNGQGLLGPMQRTLMVYELLRSVGLVPMPVVGMREGTYMLLRTSEAAGVGVVAAHIDELEGAYFGTIALEAWSVPVKDLEDLVRKMAGPHAVISVFEPTSKIVVADFVDTLIAIWDAHIEAQTPTERDDDVVTEFVRAMKHDTRGLAQALSGSLHPKEDCKIMVHEPTGTVMVTGQRQHVLSVLDRVAEIEAAPSLPGQARAINLYYPRIVPVGVLANAARGFFAYEVTLGTVRVGEIESRKHIVIESSAADWTRVQKFLAEVDVPARSVAEAEQDDLWRVQREAERIAAERESAIRKAAEKSAPRRPGLPGEPPAEGESLPKPSGE